MKHESTNRTSSVVVTEKAYAYDANGNLTNDTRFAYEWDCETRLAAVRDAATGALVQSNRYDALWRRREKVDYAADGTATTNRYIYKDWLVLAITDGEGNVLETYTHGADLSGEVGGSAGGIGGILASTQAGGVAVYAYDFNGNIVGVTDASGVVVSSLSYTPFGEVLARTGSFTPRYQFSTKEYSPRTGLNYYGYRYYSPNLGRWLSRDPLGEKYFSAFMNASYKKESYNPNKLNLHNQILLDQVHVFYIAVSNSPPGIHDGLGLVCGSGIFDHIIPDAPGGFDFTPCCQGHDDCYGDCKNRPPKEDCDDEFLNCMLGRCITEYAGAHGCANAAYAYYGAVHNYGGAAFENARASCEDCQ